MGCLERVNWLVGNGQNRWQATSTVNSECQGQCSCSHGSFPNPTPRPPAGYTSPRGLDWDCWSECGGNGRCGHCDNTGYQGYCCQKGFRNDPSECKMLWGQRTQPSSHVCYGAQAPDTICPAGYTATTQNVDGGGKQWSNHDDIQGCADACTSRHGCDVFEYAVSGGEKTKCGTYTTGHTMSGTQVSGWQTCSKSSTPPTPPPMDKYPPSTSCDQACFFNGERHTCRDRVTWLLGQGQLVWESSRLVTPASAALNSGWCRNKLYCTVLFGPPRRVVSRRHMIANLSHRIGTDIQPEEVYSLGVENRSPPRLRVHSVLHR